jgi:hypothetical protein
VTELAPWFVSGRSVRLFFLFYTFYIFHLSASFASNVASVFFSLSLFEKEGSPTASGSLVSMQIH